MRKLAILVIALLAASACGKKDDGNKKKAEPPKKAEAEPPKKAEPPPPDPALVERGGYLVGLLGCPLCHTPFGPQGPDMSKMFAGGFEFEEEFGTWRSPNITQDKKTGIGDWTDEQILTTIRTGKRPDGTQLFPIMPYLYYNKMSDDDGKAIVAFLRTVKPVENAVEGNTDLKLPKIPAPPPEGKAPEDDPVKQGEYLVTLMHCHFCHTPMTEQGPDMAKSFSGGFAFKVPESMAAVMGSGTLYSANITSDKKTGIGKYTDDELKAVFREFKKKDGTPVFGPMRMYEMSWTQMQEDDLNNIVAYVRTIPPIANKVPKGDYKPPAGPPPGAAPNE